MVERAPDKCEVVGSNPTWAKLFGVIWRIFFIDNAYLLKCEVSLSLVLIFNLCIFLDLF